MERRAWIRFARDVEVTYRQAGAMKDAGWPGRVVDVSVGGLGLLLRHRFEPGTQLAVEVNNRAGTFRRTLLARVRHATAVIASGDPRWLVGCEFDQHLTEEELKALV
jgi:PilZ domain